MVNSGAPSMPDPEISVIVPLYNEEQNVEPLYRAITSALHRMHEPYEILFVDDGSRDGTFDQAKRLAQEDKCLRVIRFRTNYGQTPAMAAGIEHAAGAILLTMDGDLQNDPEDIPILVAKLREGFDLVAGWRRIRKDKFLSRRLPSIVANWLISKVTKIPIKDNGCSLKAYRASVMKNLPLYSEMHRFIPAVSSMAGIRIAQVPVRHHPRRFGQSKYGLSRIYKVLLDLVTIKTLLTFISRPHMFFSWIAVPSALLGLLLISIAVIRWWLNPDSPVTMIIGIAALSLILAIIVLLWGILADLLYRTGDQKLEDLAKLTLTAPDLGNES